MPKWEEWNLIPGSTATEFPSLRYLSLSSCPKLKGSLPRNLPSLTELNLSYCGLLQESGHSDDNSSSHIIRSLSDVFSQMMLSLHSLRNLSISCFSSLTCFPGDGLPKTLQSLNIQSCHNLEFLPRESLHNYTSLEDLTIIGSCDSMTSFALGSLPVLKSIKLSYCENLKLVFTAEDATQSSLPFLQSIEISGCKELESFSLGGLPTPNLIHLKIYGCEKLNSLPEPIDTLTCLQELEIHNLPNLHCFAKEGLPVSLRQLEVRDVGGISSKAAIAKWSLERLTCLSVFKIKGDVVVKALMNMEVPLLPTSLGSLFISDLEDIKCLDGRWLQHLTSLQKLHISDSPNLESLPEVGFPSSLSVLRINKCPLLKASFQRKRGKAWPTTACIPFIFIDGEQVTI